MTEPTAVNNDTEAVEVPDESTITIQWKPLLKKVAAYTAAALAGAGIYAIVTSQVDDFDDYESDDDMPELDAE